MKTIISTAVACLVAGVAFAAPPAGATTSATGYVAPSGTPLAITRDATPILVARRGADDPPGDVRHGRGKDDTVTIKRQGADDPPGDVRRGRGKDDGVNIKRQGADDPPGDVRRGRGRDDAPNHG